MQVDAEQNITAMEAIVAESGNENVTIVNYPTANHLFQEAITGSVDEYGTLDQTFLLDLLPTITEWLSAWVMD